MDKKILLYTPFVKMGGIEKVSIEFLKILKENGIQVELLVDYDMRDKNVLLDTLPCDVEYSFVKGPKLSNFIYVLRSLAKRNKVLLPLLLASVLISDFFLYHLKVKKLVKKKKYDMVITFYQFLPTYLANNSYYKNVLWLHGSLEHFIGGSKNLFKKMYLRKFKKYDKVVTISDEMLDQLLTIYPQLNESQVARIYNPLDFNLIAKKSIDKGSLSETEKQIISKPFICHVSRVDENQKDISTLIKAYANVIACSAITHNLVIVGSGPDVDNLKALSEKMGVSEKVCFIGNQLNPYVWMKQADALVLSSKFEGFGLVLVEAMAVGTFVISSACKTGPREILGNGQCGDLFEVGNVQMLSKAIEDGLKDKSYRDRKIALASQRILAFDRQRIAKQLLELVNR